MTPPELHSPEPTRTFPAPWAADAFALTLALHERGAFTWAEWSAALGQVVGATAPDADEEPYWCAWVDALEGLVTAKGIGSSDAIHALEHAWADAARRTPHGQPIMLGPVMVGAEGPR